MWGDLWTFPFLASVWGTVSSWFGVLGTVISIGTAAFYYVRNLRREEHAQARHVTFVSRSWNADRYSAVVYNLSDESVFDVSPSQQRVLRFRDVLERVSQQEGRVSDARIEELRTEWRGASGGIFQVQSDESGHVKPGEHKDIVFRGPRSFAQSYTISFRDAMARHWQLELDTVEPVRIRDQDSLRNRIGDAARHPIHHARQAKQRYEHAKWLDKHANEGGR